MHVISSYRGNRPPTHTQTHPQTGPITTHCATASAQCKNQSQYRGVLIAIFRPHNLHNLQSPKILLWEIQLNLKQSLEK